jgi:PhnB protein
MTVRLNPYLSFRDNAREAMTFYQSVFGGTLTLNTFGEQQPIDDPAERDKIMHGMLENEDGFTLMGADTPQGMEYAPPAGTSISLSGDEEATLRRYWDGLSTGGTVVVPLEKAPWGDFFGMCTDRFGVPWMVNILGSPA